jgi:hypothetical protein
MAPKIEFLESVDIRKVWSKEDRNFTPWIADTSVTAKLLDQCGIDYDGELTIQTEVTLPGYKRKLDVLVKSSSGDCIAIENQFNEIDHDHMTRALAYAVGLEAKAVIIIAESHRPEFVAVANYLNAAALAYQEKGIPVFLVAIELFAAPSGGAYFPRFEIVARPDEWKAAVFQGTHNSSPDSERDIGLFNFHAQFLPDLREATGIFRNVKPSSNNWKAGSIGLSGVRVTYNVSKNSVIASIWLHVGDAKLNSDALNVFKNNSADVQKMLGKFVSVWREQGTSSIDVLIEGIGWAYPDNLGARNQLLDVLSKLTAIAKKYEPELRNAISESE